MVFLWCFFTRYGTDSLRNAVESSLIPVAGHRESEYFKELLEERAMMDALLKSGKVSVAGCSRGGRYVACVPLSA